MSFGRIGVYAFLALLVCYCGLSLYPAAYYGETFSAGGITLYSREPLPVAPEAMLNRVSAAVAADDFAGPDQKFEVYLGGGFGEYAFWAPFCGKTHACLHPVTGKIFIAAADAEKNSSYGPSGEGDRRILENVITHFLVKAQIKNRLGALKYAALADWKKNGYAEYVARETADLQPSAICGDLSSGAELPRLLRDRLVIETVRNMNEITYSEIIQGSHGPDSALARLMQEKCPR